MRLPLVLLTALIFTPSLGLAVVVAAALGVPNRPGGFYDRCSRLWASMLVRSAGVRVKIHNPERMNGSEARVYVSNHVSWYDVFVLASVLPAFRFVAKSELARIPIFGPAARAAGTIFIDRDNRKAAMESYAIAGLRIREGSPVVVYPEGTRGQSYDIRPFKKGPMVLAISAGVPVVPVVIHGTMAIQPRGSWWISSGQVNLHFLEPVTTGGLAYDDRERLSRIVAGRMATALRDRYGVESAAILAVPQSPHRAAAS